jgi:hypothetical protein
MKARRSSTPSSRGRRAWNVTYRRIHAVWAVADEGFAELTIEPHPG